VLTIAGLHARAHREAVSRELAAVGVVEWCNGADALIERIRSPSVDAAIVELTDESGRSIAPTIAAIAAARARLPIIVHDQVTRVTVPQVLAIWTAGLPIELAVRHHQPLVPLLHRMMADTFRPGVAPILLRRFVPRAPPALRVFATLAASAAPLRLSVRDIAAWAGVSSRTIDRRLARATWPPARVVLQSFSALDAVWLMTEYNWTAQRVLRVRRFSHASSVSRLLFHYCGVLPSALRESGGFSASLSYVMDVVLPVSDSGLP
jgi:AraC-like DNA-binding protein